MLPTPPPLDPDGNVVPHNHSDIHNADGIIRRVSPQQVVPDPKSVGGRKLSSIVFNPSSSKNGGLSVDLKRPIVEDGIDPIAHVTSPRWIGSVILTAQDFRDETLMVGYHPIPDNAYHGEVWGNFSDGRKKRLLRIAQWFVAIPGVQHPCGLP